MENAISNKQTSVTAADYECVKQLFGDELIAERDAALEIAKKKAQQKTAREAKARSKGKVTGTVKKNMRISKELAAEGDAKVILRKVNELCVAREKYETETLARSNKELYGILGAVYKLFLDAVRSGCLKLAVTQMRDVLAERGVRVQKNTNALTVFVRYVFNSDRKRAYNYASTLQAALQADVDADKLAEFIEGRNGVEECRREFKKSDDTRRKEEQLAVATERVVDKLNSMQALQVVKLDDTRVEFAEGTQFVFVVARANADGTLELLQVVNKTTLAMQNAAIKELAKNYDETQEEEEQASTEESEATGTVKVTLAKEAAKLTLQQLENA